MNQFQNQNFYEILEVAPNGNQEEIYRAFHRAKATYSPNSPAMYSIFSREEATELMRLIEEAYSVLSDPARRREYDLKLLEHQNAYPDIESQARALENPMVEPPFENIIPPGATPDELSALPPVDSVLFERGKTSEAVATMNSPYGVTPVTASGSHKPDTIEAASFKVASSAASTGASTGVGTGAGATSGDQSRFGKTRYSHFEIDPDFEMQIKNQDIFDGTFLAKVRNYKRVTLDQLSEASRIGRHYLSAVEGNDFTSLPAPVFVRGFIVQYARVLELDEKRVTNSYMKLMNDSRTK